MGTVHLVLLLVCGVGAISSAHTNLYLMFPRLDLTPGDVLTTDANIVCVSGYASSVRKVPESLKRTVFLSYGITKRLGDDWEIDHLISLELGGSNSIRNLWPESGSTQPLNYHIKDRLENAMHDLVCNGQITLQEAQRGIATNWALLYKTWLGNLKDGTDPSAVLDPLSPQIVPAAPSSNPVSSTRGVPPNTDGSCPATSPIKV